MGAGTDMMQELSELLAAHHQNEVIGESVTKSQG